MISINRDIIRVKAVLQGQCGVVNTFSRDFDIPYIDTARSQLLIGCPSLKFNKACGIGGSDGSSISDSGAKNGGKWIQSAIKHPGGLHQQLHIPQGEKIPQKTLNKAAHSDNPLLAKRANLAKTLEGMHRASGDQTELASGGSSPAINTPQLSGYQPLQLPSLQLPSIAAPSLSAPSVVGPNISNMMSAIGTPGVGSFSVPMPTVPPAVTSGGGGGSAGGGGIHGGLQHLADALQGKATDALNGKSSDKKKRYRSY